MYFTFISHLFQCVFALRFCIALHLGDGYDPLSLPPPSLSGHAHAGGAAELELSARVGVVVVVEVVVVECSQTKRHEMK